ncbi:MAG TPA: hypothetical protein VJT50_13530 [Pyrinomonadaceae bacterium]|nr:hypothetical protein [Pyrinomonadaceae bacterium]
MPHGNDDAKDPALRIRTGVGKIVAGDAFLWPAIYLSLMKTSIQSLLWLLLLLPAFFLVGTGLADVLRAKQIRRAQKQKQLDQSGSNAY